MDCHVCSRRIRWDEHLELTRIEPEPAPMIGSGSFTIVAASVPTRQVYACPECVARLNGQPPPMPKRYPVGSRIPHDPRRSVAMQYKDGDMPICGLCRIALPWGVERGENLRIHPEMIDAEARRHFGEFRAVLYPMCAECLAFWRPRSLAYLKRLCRNCNTLDCAKPDHCRHVPETMQEWELAGDLML